MKQKLDGRKTIQTNSTSKKSMTLTMLFADDQIIIFITKDKLQKAACKLNQMTTEHGLTISAHKTQVMAFKGPDPVRI